MTPVFLAGIGVLIVAGLGLMIAELRRRRRPVRQVRAGQEVLSTRARRAGGVSRVNARPASDSPTARATSVPREARWRPSLKTREHPVPQKSSKVPKPPASWPSGDPVLTKPVLLEAGWHQSVYHGACTIGRLRLAVRVATARGRSHAYNGTVGQDVAGVTWNGNRQAVFAVIADGVGSKPDSGMVAREAVEQTLDMAGRLRREDDARSAFRSVVDAIGNMAHKQGIDGASTLVIAEVRADGDQLCVTTWGLGDSEAWLLDNGAWTVLYHERRADAENITRHLPGHNHFTTAIRTVRPGAVLTVASDGFATALSTSGNTPVARQLTENWRNPPVPTDFLNQVNFEDPRFHDDRAAVVVWTR